MLNIKSQVTFQAKLYATFQGRSILNLKLIKVTIEVQTSVTKILEQILDFVSVPCLEWMKSFEFPEEKIQHIQWGRTGCFSLLQVLQVTEQEAAPDENPASVSLVSCDVYYPACREVQSTLSKYEKTNTGTPEK